MHKPAGKPAGFFLASLLEREILPKINVLYQFRREVILLAINFFERELTKLRNRFRDTYGRMNVYSVSNRDSTILTLIGMGVAERRINSAKNKDEVREDIRMFIKTRNYLNDHFDQLEKIIERRRHVERAKQRDSEEHSKAV